MTTCNYGWFAYKQFEIVECASMKANQAILRFRGRLYPCPVEKENGEDYYSPLWKTSSLSRGAGPENQSNDEIGMKTAIFKIQHKNLYTQLAEQSFLEICKE